MAQTEATTPAGQERLREAEGQWGRLDDLAQGILLASVMGKDWVPEAIARRFHEASSHPTDTHRALARLSGATFVTTNYDQLLEAAIQERTRRPPPPGAALRRGRDGREPRAGATLKPHGDVDVPRSVVLKTGRTSYRVGHEAPRAWKERLRRCSSHPIRFSVSGTATRTSTSRKVVNELRGAYEGKLRGPFWLEVESFVNSVKADALALRPVWLARTYEQGRPLALGPGQGHRGRAWRGPRSS